MIRRGFAALFLVSACAGGAACSGSSNDPASPTPTPAPAPVPDAGPGPGTDRDAEPPAVDGGPGQDSGPTVCTGTIAECEQAAAGELEALLAKPTDLAAFLKAVPKGGDLHNHLTGAVYAETYLGGQKPKAAA